MALTRDVAGRRYALAIVDLARERDELDAWGEAIDSLEALTAVPAHVAVLQADGLTDERFQVIVREVAPGIGTLQMNLFRLLRRKGRLALGPSIASYFRDLSDEARGIVRVQVRTAVELDEERRRGIAEEISRWTGNTVEVEVEVDAALLGGAVIRIGDQLIDGSTRGRLRALRQQLARGVFGGTPA